MKSVCATGSKLSGQSPAQALRAAQLEFLKNARASGKRANPYYWGAFVHTGVFRQRCVKQKISMGDREASRGGGSECDRRPGSWRVGYGGGGAYIITAEEVADLDLAGTHLVVLSACQTALGEAQGGEGVLGLRRAFVLAGAENLVMSLWAVPDVATKDLLTDFYKRYLSGESPAQALRAAQLEFLTQARASGKRANPYYWGAFVHTGIGTK
jgi:CHAT domain-containing protein